MSKFVIYTSPVHSAVYVMTQKNEDKSLLCIFGDPDEGEEDTSPGAPQLDDYNREEIEDGYLQIDSSVEVT